MTQTLPSLNGFKKANPALRLLGLIIDRYTSEVTDKVDYQDLTEITTMTIQVTNKSEKDLRLILNIFAISHFKCLTHSLHSKTITDNLLKRSTDDLQLICSNIKILNEIKQKAEKIQKAEKNDIYWILAMCAIAECTDNKKLYQLEKALDSLNRIGMSCLQEYGLKHLCIVVSANPLETVIKDYHRCRCKKIDAKKSPSFGVVRLLYALVL